MKKSFFRGKILLLVGLFAFTAVCSEIIYAFRIRNVRVIELSARFYFLLSAEQEASVSASTLYFSGGSGYVLNRSGEAYAVLACYLQEEDAKQVQSELSKKEYLTAIRKEECTQLYLKTRSQKRNETVIVNGFNILNSCTRLLYELSVKADSGKYSQEKLKFALDEMKSIFLYSAEAFESIGLSECFRYAVDKLDESMQGVIYAKDIRYLQVYLADAYLRFSKNFSL